MFYHRSLTQLAFDQNIFRPILTYALDAKTVWKKAYDGNGALWNVEELPLDPEQFPILKEIYDGLQAEFKRPSFFLSRVLPGGLVNHIDHRKWGNLAFPLTGELQVSPIRFLDPFNHILEEIHFQQKESGQWIPVLFNTRMTHAVPLSLDASAPRIILMMDIFDWPDSLFAKVDNGEIWKRTEHFLINS